MRMIAQQAAGNRGFACAGWCSEDDDFLLDVDGHAGKVRRRQAIGQFASMLLANKVLSSW